MPEDLTNIITSECRALAIIPSKATALVTAPTISNELEQNFVAEKNLRNKKKYYKFHRKSGRNLVKSLRKYGYVQQRRKSKNLRLISKFRLRSKIFFYKPKVVSGVKKKAWKEWSHRIAIKITSNNIFCTLIDRRQGSNKVISVASAGQYNIKITKKRLKRSYKHFLLKFFAKIWPLLSVGGVMIFITAPIRIRKKIVSLISSLRAYRYKSKTKKGRRALFIKVKHKKCFNGCRPPKKRRKKRKGLRLTK